MRPSISAKEAELLQSSFWLSWHISLTVPPAFSCTLQFRASPSCPGPPALGLGCFLLCLPLIALFLPLVVPAWRLFAQCHIRCWKFGWDGSFCPRSPVLLVSLSADPQSVAHSQPGQVKQVIGPLLHLTSWEPWLWRKCLSFLTEEAVFLLRDFFLVLFCKDGACVA